MNLTRKIYTTRREKVIDFIIGIVGWHIINIAMTIGSVGLSYLFFLAPADNATLQRVLAIVSLCLSCAPWLVNIALLIYFGVTRHWIALGALATIGFYILLTICATLVIAVLCFTSGNLP